MTTSKQKAIGSAAERSVAKVVDGIRIGMDGGPVDVVVPDYASLQVKCVKVAPSINAIRAMLAAMPKGLLRGAVIIERAGRGHPARRTITFDLDEWALWHGSAD